jgi:HPr Serine kinase C-terminal domain
VDDEESAGGLDLLTIAEIEGACERSEPIPASDAVHARMEFPFRKRLFPLGFPLDVSSNSEDVIEAAEEGWSAFVPQFETQPISIQVGVFPANSSEIPPAPTFRAQRNLLSFVADRDNFGVTDMASGFSSIWLTTPAIKSRSYLRYFFLDCAMFAQIATRYATGVHAACLTLNEIGVLLVGDSGAGKSTLAYACAKAGWTFVTDDGSFLVHGREDHLVAGNCHQIRFRPSAGSIFPEMQKREITQRCEITKPSIEVSTTNLKGVRVSQTANAHLLIFLNRREGANEPLRPYNRDVAREFLRQGRFAPLDLMPRHYAAIERLLEIEVLELRYRDLDWAIEQLNALAFGG